jgi:hypothetical protein
MGNSMKQESDPKSKRKSYPKSLGEQTIRDYVLRKQNEIGENRRELDVTLLRAIAQVFGDGDLRKLVVKRLANSGVALNPKNREEFTQSLRNLLATTGHHLADDGELSVDDVLNHHCITAPTFNFHVLRKMKQCESPVALPLLAAAYHLSSLNQLLELLKDDGQLSKVSEVRLLAMTKDNYCRIFEPNVKPEQSTYRIFESNLKTLNERNIKIIPLDWTGAAKFHGTGFSDWFILGLFKDDPITGGKKFDGREYYIVTKATPHLSHTFQSIQELFAIAS